MQQTPEIAEHMDFFAFLLPAIVSAAYAGGVKKVLLCKLLTGREYRIDADRHMLGAPLQPGYDSHVVAGGQEIVIYDAAQILPCYVISWN